MNELITKVEQWAKDKGLNQADPKAQFLKVAEEFGEIASAMARSNDELFKDSVGDVIVTLIILSMQKGTNVQECLEMAYNEIKGRTGKMVDGVFVKLSDLEESYEVEKEPLYRVKIGEGYFVEYQGRGALIMPDCNKEIKIFDSKSDAERTAQTIGGTVEEVAER
ncbi:hypothetical protein HC353_12770 [Enterococcus faecium]|nr:MazG-like family protein [Enterococcus faecium]MBL4998374.1 hypothetical protein [Enterococcus lactis]AYQ60103.1 hypothetical protein EA467_06545 [Enterococcus faecium]MDQ8236496.1 MazG-like family protein [Enterococcus faecium]MDQ8309790.1 MazG-like family protein [Enterococcus faecium]MEB5976135.1 MazG-like family protein [Enterococcus faecium]